MLQRKTKLIFKTIDTAGKILFLENLSPIFIMFCRITPFMRIAVFSDVHNNHKNLEALIEAARIHGASRLIGLGDFVNSGRLSLSLRASIEQTISLLIKNGVACLKGNHDQKLVDAHPYFIGGQYIDYLASLPEAIVLDELPHVLFTHKSPKKSRRVVPQEEFQYMQDHHAGQRIVFFGHYHRRQFFDQNGAANGNKHPRISFNEAYDVSSGRFLINPGTVYSLGMRFPQSPSFAVYDSDYDQLFFSKLNGAL